MSSASSAARVSPRRGRWPRSPGGWITLAPDGGVGVHLDGDDRRGSYHPEQTPFPTAFVTGRDGDAVLVAATDWNRLDAFSPTTGALLTPREPTTYEQGETPDAR